jgi:Cu(I)/Ag(I) efflux system membrane fusion protein
MNPEGGIVNVGHNHGGGMEMDESSTNKTNSMKMNTEKVKIDEKAKQSLVPVFENYFELKNALTQDNYVEATKAIKKVQNSLKKVDMKLFKGDAHQVWMDLLGKIQLNLKQADNSNNIEQMRASFIGISKTMIQLNDTFQPLNYPTYVQHCPMANDNKGADWLSKDKEINNPYFGSSMLTCGEIKSK